MAALSMDGIPMTALPNSADQITFDNTGTGMSATMVDTAIKELNTNKQAKSDNSLQTTQKEIVPAINELKSGLNNVPVHTSVSCGMGAFTKDIDLSSYTGKIVMVNVYSDTATNNLTAACIVAVPEHGGAARIIAYNDTDSYITFSAANQVLTITSLGGYSFGVIAHLTIV